MKTENVKRTIWRVTAGLGAGVAGASLVIAVQWYGAYMIPAIQNGYTKAWEIDPIWLREFLIIMAVSVIVSVTCFKKLHNMDSAEQEQRLTHKNNILLLITGICLGIVLRLLGGSALLWYDIKVMESKGVVYLGDSIITIEQLAVMGTACLIAAICLFRMEDDF